MHAARLVPVLVLAALACASGNGGVPDPAPELAYSSEVPVRLEIDNKHWASVRVFVQHDGMRTRLGDVPAVSRQRFLIGERSIGTGGEIRLIADPLISSDGPTSESLTVLPGQRIVWTLEHRLAMSSLAVKD